MSILNKKYTVKKVKFQAHSGNPGSIGNGSINNTSSGFPTLPVSYRYGNMFIMQHFRVISVKTRDAKNENGYYKPTEKAITTGPCVKNELIKQYQLKCMELAKNALLRNKKLPQVMSTKMISISEQGFKRIQERLRKIDTEIRSLVHKDENPADRVYQLNILLFPNSK